MLEDQPNEKLRQDVADLLVSRAVNLPAEERVFSLSGPIGTFMDSVARCGRIHRGPAKTVVAGRLPWAINQRPSCGAIGQRIPGDPRSVQTC